MAKFAKTNSITVGDIKITFLADGGGIVIPTALYPASTEEGWQRYPDLLNEEGKFITSIGSFLIETGDRKVAVDTGIGPVELDFPGFGPFVGGKYLDSLKETGVDRNDVTDVVFTHLHLDHCGWTTIEVDGKRELTYPNARHLVSQTEWDTWFGGEDPLGPHPEFVQKPLQDRIEYIAHGDKIAPGITVKATPGHTAGHISLIITSGNQTLYLLGDVFHGVMQLTEKTWSVAFDADAEQARRTREGLYPELTQPNVFVAANHFSDAVFGRMVEKDGAYGWVRL